MTSLVVPEIHPAYLHISGMSCAGCASRVSQILNQVAGVKLADVNFAAEQARVMFDADLVSVETLVKTVTEEGFGAVPLEDWQQQDPDLEVDAGIASAQQRLWVGLIPAGILASVMLYCMVMNMPHNQHHQLLTLTLAFPVVFVAGWATHVSSWKALRHGSANMDVLISLGTVPTYLVGLTGIPEVTVFVEVAAVVMAFHLISRYLEKRAKGRASQAIRRLMNLQVRQAHLQPGRDAEMGDLSRMVDVPIEMVQVGDWLVVKPGEAIPTDGRVVMGGSTVNESMATGSLCPFVSKRGMKSLDRL